MHIKSAEMLPATPSPSNTLPAPPSPPVKSLEDEIAIAGAAFDDDQKETIVRFQEKDPQDLLLLIENDEATTRDVNLTIIKSNRETNKRGCDRIVKWEKKEKKRIRRKQEKRDSLEKEAVDAATTPTSSGEQGEMYEYTMLTEEGSEGHATVSEADGAAEKKTIALKKGALKNTGGAQHLALQGFIIVLSLVGAITLFKLFLEEVLHLNLS